MISAKDSISGTSRWIYALRICDALLFPVLFHQIIDAVILYTIDIYSAKKAILVIVLSMAILVGAIPLMKEKGSRWLKYASCPVTIIAASCVVIYFLSHPFSWYASRYLWMGWFPPEWHQLPLAWGGFFITLWKFYFLFFALIVLILFLHVHGNQHALIVFNTLFVLLIIRFAYKSDPDAIFVVLMLLTPLLIAIVFGYFRQPIPERRFTVFGIFFCAMAANYVGLIPPTAPRMDFPGLAKIYPTQGHSPLVSLAHIRDVVTNEKADRLYVSWGPTSGIFSVDLATNREKHLYEKDSLRYLDSTPDKQILYGVTWVKTNYIELSAEKNKLIRSVSLLKHGMGQLWISRHKGSDIYISCYDPPMLGRFNYATFKPEAIRDFRKGQTILPAGGGFFVFSPDGTKIYINLGITDIPMAFTILELDSKTLEILRSIRVPEIPYTLIYDGETDRVMFASGYSSKIFEIDPKTGAVARMHPSGVIHARMFLYDKSRRWIIVGSYYTGTLTVIDRDTSQRLISRRIARRIQFGHLSETSDSIYMTTTEGIYKIELKEVEKYLSRNKNK